MTKKKELRPEVSFHDIELGQVVTREMNDQEYAEYTENMKAYENKKAVELEKEKLRESALAKFLNLGITEEDLKAVFA